MKTLTNLFSIGKPPDFIAGGFLYENTNLIFVFKLYVGQDYILDDESIVPYFGVLIFQIFVFSCYLFEAKCIPYNLIICIGCHTRTLYLFDIILHY